jgi:hypothetical protein
MTRLVSDYCTATAAELPSRDAIAEFIERVETVRGAMVSPNWEDLQPGEIITVLDLTRDERFNLAWAPRIDIVREVIAVADTAARDASHDGEQRGCRGGGRRHRWVSRRSLSLSAVARRPPGRDPGLPAAPEGSVRQATPGDRRPFALDSN